jgi:RIO-like serine/threonine protein kinase
MKTDLYDLYIKNFDVNLLDCSFLGRGHNGAVYMLPEGKVIKICFEEDSCQKEYYILNRIKCNKYFPKVYGMNGNYIIRDFVDGVCLDKYIKKHGLDSKLSLKIIKLLEEFSKLKFLKEDTRCKDIMVKPDGTLMVIDPKKFYSKKRNFPKHLSKGLYNLGVLEDFMEVVKQERPKLYIKWNDKINEYINLKVKEYDSEKRELHSRELVNKK